MRIKVTSVLLIGTTLFLLSGRGLAASEKEALEELKNCARIEDSAVRVACYEELGKRVLGDKSIKTTEVAVVEPADAGPDVVQTEVIEAEVVEPKVVEPEVEEPAVNAPQAAEKTAAAETKVVETAPSQPKAQGLPDDLGIEKKGKKEGC